VEKKNESSWVQVSLQPGNINVVFTQCGSNSMAVHLTKSNCKEPKVGDGTDDHMLWNDSEEDGEVRNE